MITPGMIGMHMLPRCPILSSQLKQSQVDFDSDPTRDRTCTRFWEFQRMQMRPLSRRLELGSSARCCETDHSWPGLQEVVHSATCLKEIYIVTYCNWGSSPSKTWKYTYSTVQYSLVEAWWKHHGNMEWFCLLAVNRSHALFGWSLDQQAALRYHPDKSPDEASKAKFAEIRSWALWRVISTIITIFKYIIIYMAIYCNCVNLCFFFWISWSPATTFQFHRRSSSW
jgi:hypothetical protein